MPTSTFPNTLDITFPTGLEPDNLVTDTYIAFGPIVNFYSTIFPFVYTCMPIAFAKSLYGTTLSGAGLS